MLQRTGSLTEKTILEEGGALITKSSLFCISQTRAVMERKSVVGHAPVAFLLHISEILEGCFQVHSVLICLSSHEHHHQIPQGPVGAQVSC